MPPARDDAPDVDTHLNCLQISRRAVRVALGVEVGGRIVASKPASASFSAAAIRSRVRMSAETPATHMSLSTKGRLRSATSHTFAS
eukprot:4277891-Prymnesium_polylepis.2